jgi:hypothetical protein
VQESHDFLSPSPSPNFGLQSESESECESDEMAGSEKLCNVVVQFLENKKYFVLDIIMTACPPRALQIVRSPF